MSLLPKRQAPATRRLLRAEVVRTERTSEHFVTITLGGPGPADFTPLGRDQWFRLFFRRDGQDELRLPTASNTGWMAQCLLMRLAVRPWVRSYTVRAFRPGELDVDVVVHGDTSPGSAFALHARPGEEVGLLDEGITYLPPAGARQLIAADESGVPAASAILESAPADLVATVFLEVPAKSDVREVPAPSGVDVRWLVREDDARPGQLALTELTHTAPAPDYAWIAGESGLATGARRFLNRERGVPKSAIAFLGYWRRGWSAPG